MRRYECFRRRERFLGVLVFAKLIRISIADELSFALERRGKTVAFVTTEPLRRAPLCRACGLWFPEKKGFSTFRWAEGS